RRGWFRHRHSNSCCTVGWNDCECFAPSCRLQSTCSALQISKKKRILGRGAFFFGGSARYRVKNERLIRTPISFIPPLQNRFSDDSPATISQIRQAWKKRAGG